MQPTDHPKDPVNQLAPKGPGAQPADDHDRIGPPPAETIARGYELDTFDAKSVLSVPLLVVLFFVLAFGTVTVIFRFIAYPEGDSRAHPGAKERNARPLNERMAGISRSRDGDQPRLEPLKLRDSTVPGKDTKLDMSRAITRPELPSGNSPEIHPEDLRATKDRYPALFESGGKDNKVPLNKVLELDDKALKALFPVQAAASRPIPSQHYPTAYNAGRGAEESVVEVPVPPAPPAPAPKKDEPKKDAPKVDVPKAPEPPKATEPPKENKK
jgi:hypothetical protein